MPAQGLATGLPWSKFRGDAIKTIPVAFRLQTHNGSKVPLGLYKDTACTIKATIAGDLIAAWRDELSGSLVTLIQPTVGLRAALQFINGTPVVKFDGIDDYMFVAHNAAYSLEGDFTIFVGVTSYIPTGATLSLYSKDNGASPGAIYTYINAANQVGSDRPFVAGGPATAAPLGTPQLLTTRYGTGQLAQYFNGALQRSDAQVVGTLTATNFLLAAFNNAGVGAWGNISLSHLIVANYSMAAAIQTKVETYLIPKL